ncbi:MULTISPECIES: DMT family transporter [Prochlorococcus]|uniref:Permease of the drug/metabolite transporter, DMT superfamily n=3 Tax=Prochlorococcus TaxID=1218 RepID=Q7VB06_PROMA|nr:DMT family transporter [Prochlorococcus marinus]AAQ00339.1 Permease of the drug/metabolite transporter, DMT superfamily [Prochlorococcus marinus subsp. marinus str. CCMP1375]KGG14218.1 Permease of the drug/metabolite transporter (DMT) [Prochlorococcus marinus str. LG]KGG22210.1 Permease of the drug/metabolite transporter (DMT) [Prochlorococcus marinus str. SS2]KGG24473.1 Permease of the drug/metabolite transporter (DMT) [Prochlorococcus marinus str. SS35]KGG33368.1 Permease of the drug/meta
MFEKMNWLLMVLPFALWGSAMAAMAPLVQSSGPEFVAILRLFPSGIAILIAVIILKRPLNIARIDLGWFLVFTLIDGSLFQFFLTRGLVNSGAGLGSVFIDSQPLIVALLARTLFGDPINPIGWIGLVLGLGGIICIGTPPELLSHWFLMNKGVSESDVLANGQFWMLGAALAMALGTVLIRFTCKASDPVAVTGWHMVFGSIPLAVWHFFDKSWPLFPQWSAFDWGLMSYAAFLGSALAYGLFFWFASQTELTSFSTLAFLTPVFALITGGVWLGERLDWVQWIGVSFVLFSVFLVSQRARLWEPISDSRNNLFKGISG